MMYITGFITVILRNCFGIHYSRKLHAPCTIIPSYEFVKPLKGFKRIAAV